MAQARADLLVPGRAEREQQQIAVLLAPGRQAASRAVSRLKHGGVAIGFGTLAGAAGVCSLLVALVLRVGWPFCGTGLCPTARPYLPVLVAAGVVRMALFVLGGHHRNRRYAGIIDEMVDGFREAGLGSLILVLFTFFYREGLRFRAFSYSRTVFIFDWILFTFVVTALIILAKSVLIGLRQKGYGIRNVVVVGSGKAAESFIEEISGHPEAGYRVAAHLPDPADDDADLVERLVELTSLVRVDEIVMAAPGLGRQDINQLVEAAELRNIEIRAVPDLFGLPPRKVTLASAGEFPVLSLLQEPLPGIRRFIKRAMDIAIASVGLLVLGPLMLLAALAVRVTSRGPILFRQQRMGMDGRPFDMLKFRTMYPGSDSKRHEAYVTALIKGEAEPVEGEGAALYKLVNDPRVTPVGRILRRFSIDELPQLVNVLKGDMSLVGPRPPLAFEVAAYKEWQRQRLDVRPGVTGLWQVSGRSRMTFEEMVRLDIDYIKNWSPARDLAIMLRTIPALIRKEAA